ncbi:nucleoside triphosphate pyrophosphohydrolase family protein [Candidatus Saccharibacteria bacterium]|nr:nucleoside triphosphate pyrophosphohydrolase family protein [Candidatus Saccharibacteria bacterium]
MNLDKYQKQSAKYDLFETSINLESPGFLEKVLGLVGEAGETADKIKKIIRDKGGHASEEDRESIIKELGDTLWYLAGVARYLGVPLSEVAKGNIKKLESRYKRNKLHGEGDNR